MSQETFIQTHNDLWNLLNEQIRFLATKKRNTPEPMRLDEFPYLFRQACHHLALAKDRHYSSQLIHRLNELALQGHAILYRKRILWPQRFLVFVFIDFPSKLRENSGMFFLAAALLFVPMGIMLYAVNASPDLVYSVLDESQVRDFDAMYSKESKSLGRIRDSASDFQMFGHYIYNNISIAFRVFAAGMLLGVGSMFFLVLNGVVMGAVVGFVIYSGNQERILSFVVGHSAFELLAIAISGCAGLMLGWSIINPGSVSRIDALKSAANNAMTLVYGVFVMLLIAAFIEAFWSSISMQDNTIKYIVGGSLWLILALYFSFSGRGYRGYHGH